MTPRQGKHNDEAHPPIHPTAHVSNLAGPDKRLYEFIVRRFLACCSDNALGQSTVVEIDIAGEVFRATGLQVLALNYLEIYPFESWNARHIPTFKENETFTPTALEMKDGRTSPPELLSESDLIEIMDKNGIGRWRLRCI